MPSALGASAAGANVVATRIAIATTGMISFIFVSSGLYAPVWAANAVIRILDIRRTSKGDLRQQHQTCLRLCSRR